MERTFQAEGIMYWLHDRQGLSQSVRTVVHLGPGLCGENEDEKEIGSSLRRAVSAHETLRI